jgi:hypothetical protein
MRWPLIALLVAGAALSGEMWSWRASTRPALRTAAQTPGAELRARIPARRTFAHAARIVTDRQPATGRLKIWVLPGADDMRLYTPKGGQLEMDFQVSYQLGPGDPPDLPASIDLVFETHGETRPGPAPHTLGLRVDGAPVRLDERPELVRRSGALVFHASAVKMSLAEFLSLVNASRVEGRWLGHDFVLLPSQLEILRDLASRMGGANPESLREIVVGVPGV